MVLKYFPRIFLLVNGLIYGVLTGMFLLASRTWFANLGIELVDELGYTELRTMYIGMMGSLAVFSLLAMLHKQLAEPALLLFLLSYSALASVRTWGVIVEGLFDEFTLQLLYAEIVSALAAGFALWCERQTGK